MRYINRYDIENIDEESAKIAAARIFSEPQGDIFTFNKLNINENSHVIIWEYLPGQYAQRIDSAKQCLSLLLAGNTTDCINPLKSPKVRCAKMIILGGFLNADDILCIKNYFMNPIDSHITDDKIPDSLEINAEEPADIPTVDGFFAPAVYFI